MRTIRLLTLMVVFALLVSACDSALLQRLRGTPTPGFTRQPTWTRIPTLTPSITPTRTPRPTSTITPTATITPTHWPTDILYDFSPEPGAVLTSSVELTGTLGISYLQVKNTFEPLGFAFDEGIPLSATLAYTATYPAIPLNLELTGLPGSLSKAAMSFELALDDPERTNQAAGLMIRLLNLLLPAWDEAAPWLYESLQEGLTSSDDFFDRSTQRSGLSVTLEMDRLARTVRLTVGVSAPPE